MASFPVGNHSLNDLLLHPFVKIRTSRLNFHQRQQFNYLKHGIAKPVRSGADIDNAKCRLLVCGCGDEPYSILHIWPPTWLIVEPSVGQKADVLDRPQTETTGTFARHTDIGIRSDSADSCIYGTSCCRLHRLPASQSVYQQQPWTGHCLPLAPLARKKKLIRRHRLFTPDCASFIPMAAQICNVSLLIGSAVRFSQRVAPRF